MITATPQKRGHYWHASLEDLSRTPNQKHIPLKTRDQAEALHTLTTLLQQHAQGHSDLWQRPSFELGVTYRQALKRYLDRSDLGANTLRSYEWTLYTFASTLPRKALVTDVLPSHIRAYCFVNDLASSSCESRLNTLSAFFEWAIGQGLRKHNPCDEFKGSRKRRVEVTLAPIMIDTILPGGPHTPELMAPQGVTLPLSELLEQQPYIAN